MGLRKLTPLTFRPRGVSDALDGTNAFHGAMQLLADLVPAPGTPGVYVPRSASLPVTSFAGFNTPGVISVSYVIGSRVYGMIASQRFPGHDEPFCYDVRGGAFVPISGVNVNNVPRTLLTSGDWTPPMISAPTTSRLLVSHVGFTAAGPLAPFFGWLDISSFVSNNLLGNVTSGSNVITSINDGFTSAPILDGVQPGMILNASGFSGPVTVLSLQNGAFSQNTTCTTDGTTTITNILNPSGVLPGMGVSGPLFGPGTTVVSISGNTAVLNMAALASGVATNINFSGGGTITVSANATGTHTQTALAINGGTLANPLWGAGNTNTFPLSKVPKAVGAFNGRGWFAVGNAVVFSDSFNPTQVTNANQALIIGDNTEVTAFGGLPLTNQVTGGTQEALLVFKGPQAVTQITGDAATNNLGLDIVQGSVGTLAPNTITQTPEGLAYVAIDGVRMITLAGTVTQPIGAYGEGVSTPFINALYPSRMCAAFNQNTLRISFQNGSLPGAQFQEFAYEFRLKQWTGPHSFPAALINGYSVDGQVGFILSGVNLPGQLWFHSMVPGSGDTFVENGSQMEWTWKTTLLPDNNRLSANRMLDTALGLILPAFTSAQVTFADEGGVTQDTTPVTNSTPANDPLWGSVIWGDFIWGSIASFFKQYRVAWNVPLIFKQGTITVTAKSAQVQAIGNLYMGYQPLGYILEDLPAIVGYTGLESSTDFTALMANHNADGTYTALLATLVGSP